MRYTDDYEHNPILGKAGAFVDILSRVPADTDIVLYCNNMLSDRFNANALNISLSDYKPFEHTINLKDDGTLENTLKVNFCVKWNRDKNLAEAEIFAALFRIFESIFCDYKQYDCRKLPKPEAIAKTAANNPCAFLGMLNEFQKKYKGKKENHKEEGKVDKDNG